MTQSNEELGITSTYHVWPVGDLREHVLSRDCWCKPTEDDPGVIVHNSMDGREAFETGERLPS